MMSFLLMTKLEFSLAGVVHGLFSTLFDFHFKNQVRAGGQPREHSWLPNEEGYATTDMESDQLHVPASFLCYGTWLTQEPPLPFSKQPVFNFPGLHGFRNLIFQCQ